MTVLRHILGQAVSIAATPVTLYGVPQYYEATVFSVVVCNRGAATGTVSIQIVPVGEAAGNEHYVTYLMNVLTHDTMIVELQMTMIGGDTIVVTASTADFSMSAFGEEKPLGS